LISEIKNATDNRQKEDSILLLSNFLKASPFQRVVYVFMRTIVESLPVSCDVRLATAGLEALGDLSAAMRQEALPFVGQLLPSIILSMTAKGSVKKQEAAVRTLGQLISATGYVIRPYIQFPQLLPSALELLVKNPTSTPW